MDELQKQITELRQEIENLKRSSTFPYEVQKAIEERTRKVFYATATLNFGDTLAQTVTDLTVNLPQAVKGDLVVLGLPDGSVGGGIWFAWVSSDGVVTVRFANHTAGAINPASGDFKVAVIKTQI